MNETLHNNGAMMFYNQVGHQDSIRQRRNDELNEFYPPPPKLTTFTTDDANEFQADSDQSHSYMVCIKRKSYLIKYLSLHHLIHELLSYFYHIMSF